MTTRRGAKSIVQSKPSAALIRQVITSMAEPKVLSFAQAIQTVSSGGVIISLSNIIVEGDDIFNRVGTKVRLLRQTLKFRFSAVATNQSCRFILFRDMLNTGNTPAVTDVLPGGTYQSHFSDVRQIQQRRYSILHDETIDCSINGETVKSADYIEIKKTGVIRYNGATAVPTANGPGAIFLLIIGSSSTGQYDYDWQMVFNDY
jgi:hypothetical protein